MELQKTYDHKLVEDKIYKLWEKSGFFNPDKLPGARKKPFTILMPPPNASNPLHAGNAVMIALEDILIRYHRMKGEKTLWLPGEDHAGFETQVVYEKKLEKEGRSRFQMTREQFYKEVWQYTKENRDVVRNQIKKLGASCDWERDTFTLDPHIVKTVYDTFKQMFDDGLIYRAERLVNYCTKHRTAFSELEIKHEERNDSLYYITYGPITLATVRPETKFGDTAIAVHPQDKRYQQYIGKELEVETLLGKKTIKVIADESVDPEFGTGAVKVTPAHDFNDFETWQRHKQEIPGPIQVIGQDGKLTRAAGPYAGMKVLEARKKVAEDMQSRGLMERIDETYTHTVALCYKCASTIEPMLMSQWFVKVAPLAKAAAEAVQKKKISIIPKSQEKVFFHWMKNIRDWNISRQNWWGIPVPVWYCGDNKLLLKKMGFAGDVVPQVFDSKTRTYRLRDHGFIYGDRVIFENSADKKVFGYGTVREVSKTTIGEIDLQDKKHWKTYRNRKELIAAFQRHYPDKKITNTTPVWVYTYAFDRNIPATGCGALTVSETKPERCYSCKNSELSQDPDVFDTWFSSGQWPFATLGFPKGKDFKTFYPTSVLETGWDILFFWVARMIMLGLYRTGTVPFQTVYLHGLVRDKDRQKMSKSRGNVVDPLGITEQYGTDALRMALTIGNMPGKDTILSEDKVRGYRNFVNKIWNISRFLTMNTQDFDGKKKPTVNAADKKLLHDMTNLAKEVTKNIESFRLSRSAETLYHYTWHTFADNIIEQSKGILEKPNTRASRQYVLLEIFSELLKLLHPFVPFVTEELYQQLPLKNKKESLMIEAWPV